MAKLDKKYLGRYITHTDLSKNRITDSSDRFTHTIGIIRILTSEKTAPGKSSISFYPLNEDGIEDENNFFKTPYGDIYEDFLAKTLKIKTEEGYYNFVFIHGA